jgi:putative SOS response-associated peptidase YedK
MCGRFVSREQAAIEREYNVKVRNPFERVYNAAPTMALPVIRNIGGDADAGREALTMRWGLIPAWWSKATPPTACINARSEDAAAKPMWRDAVRRSRCLVPALGWYEWHAGPDGKVPYFVHLPGGLNGLCFAGLWSEWKNPNGDSQLSFAIMTRAASPPMAVLHSRMPVVLPPGSWDDWLERWPDRHAERLATQVAGSEGNFEYYAVDRYVNSTRNQGERCIQPATSPEFTGLQPRHS